MNLRRSSHDEPDVSLTPLIDVVLLLLIFFMVSTTFEREAQLQIELPEASAEPVDTPDDKLEITIDVTGNYFLNGKQVTNTRFNTLKRAIQKSIGDKTDLPVIIRADANTPHQAVISALDAARQLGLLRISLATTPGTDRE